VAGRAGAARPYSTVSRRPRPGPGRLLVLLDVAVAAGRCAEPGRLDAAAAVVLDRPAREMGGTAKAAAASGAKHARAVTDALADPAPTDAARRPQTPAWPRPRPVAAAGAAAGAGAAHGLVHGSDAARGRHVSVPGPRQLARRHGVRLARARGGAAAVRGGRQRHRGPAGRGGQDRPLRAVLRPPRQPERTRDAAVADRVAGHRPRRLPAGGAGVHQERQTARHAGPHERGRATRPGALARGMEQRRLLARG
jgi:hypothetical protein